MHKKQFEVAASLNHDVKTFFDSYNCLMLLPYAHGQHINVLNRFVDVSCRCGKQLEFAVSLNRDVKTSF